MGLTWTLFKAEVRSHLTVDAARRNVQTFIDQKILQGAKDVQRFVDLYRVGNETQYAATDFANEGLAGRGTLPDQARVRTAYLLRTELGPLASSSVTNSGATATFNATVAHGLNTGNVVTISGATPAAYNGTFRITVTDSSAFTYGMESDPGGAATGTVVAKVSSRRDFHLVHWRNRFELVNGTACLNGNPFLSIEPLGGSFLVYPLPDATTEDVVSIFWDGIKESYTDAETTPLDREAALTVAYMVKSELAREVDQDLQMQNSYLTSYLKARRSLYVDGLERRAISQ